MESASILVATIRLGVGSGGDDADDLESYEKSMISRSNTVLVLLDAYIMTTEKFAMMAEDRDADDTQPKSTDNTESLEDLKMK
eukprot:6273940-Amphidinium_carterae.1